MDLSYLLFLQNFRESTHDALTPLIEFISFFAVTGLLMAPVFLYWVIDKKKGLFAICSALLSISVNSVIKLTACVYRPWIREPRIVPAGKSIASASGYSFPSGHTATAAPVCGCLALMTRKKNRLFSALCIVFLLLTMFSRNYLGVHTPQDVLTAMFVGLLAMFVMTRIFRFLEEHPGKENLFLLGSLIIGILALIYITLKPYPVTEVNGQLLVDPAKMMKDGYQDICMLIAFPIARYVECRWVRFRPAGTNAKGIILGLAGLIPMALIRFLLKSLLDQRLGICWGHFVTTFLMILYAIALFPLVIKLVTGQQQTNHKAKEL